MSFVKTVDGGIKRKRHDKRIVKQWLKDRFPESFIENQSDRKKALDTVGVYIEEGLMRVYSFGYRLDHTNYNLQSFINYMLQGVDDALCQPRVHTAILVFDKPEYVPNNKAIEWSKRTEEMANKTIPYEWNGKDPILPKLMNASMPNWQSVLANRKAYKQAVKELIDHLKAKYCPPVGKRIIIDGGHSNVPTMIYSSFENSSRVHREELERYKNFIGEGENIALYYANEFSKGTHSGDEFESIKTDLKFEINIDDFGDVAIASKDTDLIMSSLFHASSRVLSGGSEKNEGHRFMNRLYILHDTTMACSFDPQAIEPPQNGDTGGTGVKNGQCRLKPTVINVNSIIERILGLLIKHTNNPLESFVLACYISGGDYNDSFHGITYERILDNYVDDIHEYKDLVRFTGKNGDRLELEPSSICSLLKRSTVQAWEVKKRIHKDSKKRKAEKGYREIKTTLQEASYRVVRKDVSDSGIYLDSQDYTNRMMRLWWYMLYLNNVVMYPTTRCPYPRPERLGYLKREVKELVWQRDPLNKEQEIQVEIIKSVWEYE